MSKRNTELLLQDIQISISKILQYTAGLNFEQYQKDSKTKDAVERNFEIIGEAASRILTEFKTTYTHIEWRIIKDFRNFIIHEYFGVDDTLVWDIVQNRLRQLSNNISDLLKNINTSL